MSDTTRVIFRKWPDGDIIAIFPDITEGPNVVSSYMHVGQHGAASVKLIGTLVGCTAEEYADLKKELESPPYNYQLRVVHKS